MKRILALLLLSPTLSFAQLLEVSLKGGIVSNNVRPAKLMTLDIGKNPLGYAGSLSITAGLPFNFRAGLGISAYKISYTVSGINSRHIPYEINFEYGTPVIPLEAIIAKRFNIAKFSFAVGVTGGICMDNKIVEERDWDTYTNHDATTWRTYGFVAGGQFNITRRLSLGIETQPKWLTIKNYSISPYYFPVANSIRNTFLWPVMVKASVRI